MPGRRDAASGDREVLLLFKRNASARGCHCSPVAYLRALMPSTLIVLTGPPLPGRWSLARALERRLGARRFVAEPEDVALFDIMRALAGGAATTLVDGDLPSREARAEVLELGDDSCERVL